MICCCKEYLTGLVLLTITVFLIFKKVLRLVVCYLEGESRSMEAGSFKGSGQNCIFIFKVEI